MLLCCLSLYNKVRDRSWVKNFCHPLGLVLVKVPGEREFCIGFLCKKWEFFFWRFTNTIASVHHFFLRRLFDIFEEGGFFGMYSHLDLSPPPLNPAQIFHSQTCLCVKESK